MICTLVYYNNSCFVNLTLNYQNILSLFTKENELKKKYYEQVYVRAKY